MESFHLEICARQRVGVRSNFQGSVCASRVLRRWTVTLDEINQIVFEDQRKVQRFDELSSRQAHAIIAACVREKGRHGDMKKTMLLPGRVPSATRSARTQNRAFDSPLPHGK